jgi:stage IV sporulation protein B
MGSIESRTPIGELTANTAQGVFGIAADPWKGAVIPVAEKNEVRTGSATIRSTVQGTSLQEYSVEILKIYPQDRAGGRNLLLRITDPELLALTGGIVQGMSGSPIIQNGKLVGAVTHVLVNDPTTGYGIFIENMLDAAA